MAARFEGKLYNLNESLTENPIWFDERFIYLPADNRFVSNKVIEVINAFRFPTRTPYELFENSPEQKDSYRYSIKYANHAGIHQVGLVVDVRNERILKAIHKLTWLHRNKQNPYLVAGVSAIFGVLATLGYQSLQNVARQQVSDSQNMKSEQRAQPVVPVLTDSVIDIATKQDSLRFKKQDSLLHSE